MRMYMCVQDAAFGALVALGWSCMYLYVHTAVVLKNTLTREMRVEVPHDPHEDTEIVAARVHY